MPQTGGWDVGSFGIVGLARLVDRTEKIQSIEEVT